MIKDNKLFLNISNSIPAKKRDVVSTKIGLKNTQKRLEIIYPERHKLEIKPTKTVFNVNLEIDLN
jgi:LytS/YehU family sensor histidine kinase